MGLEAFLVLDLFFIVLVPPFTYIFFSSQTGPGCDESQVHQIPYGTTKKMMKGALYQFNCDEGAVLSGSPTIFCDGKSWNDTAPTCLSKFFVFSKL
jgi:hypothetical protein